MQKKKFKYQNANNQVGVILRSHNGGPYIFHVYGEKGSFKDYDILHDDVKVQISDNSAELLESLDGQECYLDYSRKVLGQENKYDREE